MRSTPVVYGVLSILCVGLLPVVSTAKAGGLFLNTRGVRPTARAGAFVAGADDAGALWFNEAGLAQGTPNFTFDLTFVRQSVEYRRVDSGNNPQPAVRNKTPGIPAPTIAASFDLPSGARIAVGLAVPFGTLADYELDGPQRYSMGSQAGSAVMTLSAAWAKRLRRDLRFGVSVHNTIFQVANSVTMSGCLGQLVCAPEDPDFDVVGRIDQTTVFAPSVGAGVQWDFQPRTTLGASLRSPTYVTGTGKLQTRLPSSDLFDTSTILGDTAKVSFWLPPILRVAIQHSPVPRWNLEFGVDVEFWSVHKSFSIRPNNILLNDAPGIGTYEIGPIDIARNFRNSITVKAGLEKRPRPKDRIGFGFGYSFESSATPIEQLSVLTVEGPKHLLSGGVSYQGDRWKWYGTAGFVYTPTLQVDSATGKAAQLTPLRESDPGVIPSFVNWGEYKSHWIAIGVGMSRAL